MFEKFTDRARKVMALARQEAERLRHDYIGTEHILVGLIKEGSGVAANILENLNIDPDQILREIEKVVEPGTSMVSMGQLPFTPRTKKMLEYALEEMRNLGHNYIGTEHLLLGLIREHDSEAAQIMISLGIDLEQVRSEIMKILGAEPEPVGVENPGAQNNPASSKTVASKTPALDAFGRDLTALARKGSLDPVIGRTQEVERMLQILCRRTKNNPVLLGEAGVGKTAIVEGLAQRVINGDVPDLLADRRIIILDLAMMVAGTKYRGQFEERIKAVMQEVIKSKNQIILFIDELHTLVGAGAAEGSIDASNVLKPALSRGEIQVIGATTLDEYRKYIEKDSALERRFQTVRVEPPSISQSIEILNGLKDRYEEHHHVTYTQEALRMAVEFSDRYITGRFLPDKAIDVIDESGARLRLRNTVPSPDLREKETEVRNLEQQKEKAVAEQQFEQAAKFRDMAEKLRQEIAKTRKIMNSSVPLGEESIVDANVISEVVSLMTGIPVARIDSKETTRLLGMESTLSQKVVGQSEAIEAVSKALRRSRAGIKNPKRPMGCFLFVGPTGVGKTHLAKALAELMFGEADALIQIDMSEYMEKFNLSKLIGAPPGFVGYEEGGQLTEKVRRRPYSVILLDEIEKAHPDVFNILLQMMEEGRITDSFDRAVDFRNAIVIMTSNVGAQFFKGGSMGFSSSDNSKDFENIRKKLMGQLDKEFRPEFLNRLDRIVAFKPLEIEHLESIVRIETSMTTDRLRDKGIGLEFSTEAYNFLIQKGYNREMGARPLRRAIERYIEDELSEKLLRGELDGAGVVKVEKEADKEDLTFTCIPAGIPVDVEEAAAIPSGEGET